MKRKNLMKIICLMIVSLFFISTNALAQNSNKNDEQNTVELSSDDIDPLVDLEITFTVKEIRALDEMDMPGYWIGLEPDFYVKVFINGEEHKSPVWEKNKKYVRPNWSFTEDVSDYEENVDIRIEVYDEDPGKDDICDISYITSTVPEGPELEVTYNLKTGHWTGDDFIHYDNTRFDRSGYGRANGCDDNSFYLKDNDVELFFDITQNDYDGDGIPYWTEVNVFNEEGQCDPKVDDRGRDDDEDLVPIEWEFKWGYYQSYDWETEEVRHTWFYDPFEFNDHKNLDPDEDGLDNWEEYRTSQWGSDPFRKDMFIELDQMEIGPNGEGYFVPEISTEVMRDPFARRNIVVRFDTGNMDGGQKDIPFQESTNMSELRDIYMEHFLNNDKDNWRQGVFRYATIIYNSTRHDGFVYWGDPDHFYRDSFQLSTSYFWDSGQVYFFRICLQLKNFRGFFDWEWRRGYVYACAMMHESGHILGIYHSNTPGCDDTDGDQMWEINWWKWRFTYRSVMNYNRVFSVLDYSDGRRGINDFDDWDRIDLTLFQKSHAE
jgi:hypothetical protein